MDLSVQKNKNTRGEYIKCNYTKIRIRRSYHLLQRIHLIYFKLSNVKMLSIKFQHIFNMAKRSVHIN